MSDPSASRQDHVIAAQLATEAGKLLLQLRSRHGANTVWGTDLGRRGDAVAHDHLMKRLAELRPDDPVLSEEGLADSGRLPRLSASRAWIVDPLDGTREFAEIPRSDWAVHVALVVDGDPTAGAVALPARNLTLGTHMAPTPPTLRDGPPRVVVSRSRPPVVARHIAAILDGELISLGSAGAKAMAVVLGDAEVYAHAGGQYEWDSAAPVAVARAAGLHASRLDGSPLVYNQPDPYLPDLLICRPEMAERVSAAARDVGT